jgi:hypothetical protein
MVMRAKTRPIVYVVGNPLAPSDSMPLRLLPLLKKARPNLDFQPFEPTRMDIPQKQGLIFIDTIQGIKKVVHLHGIKALAPSDAAYSLHDYDLAGQLMLLDKFGLLGQVSIIGVPSKGEKQKIAKGVLHELEHLTNV